VLLVKYYTEKPLYNIDLAPWVLSLLCKVLLESSGYAKCKVSHGTQLPPT